jgi:hypothetical protein
MPSNPAAWMPGRRLKWLGSKDAAQIRVFTPNFNIVSSRGESFHNNPAAGIFWN